MTAIKFIAALLIGGCLMVVVTLVLAEIINQFRFTDEWVSAKWVAVPLVSLVIIMVIGFRVPSSPWRLGFLLGPFVPIVAFGIFVIWLDSILS
ncbi:MAG: hypothetical protein CMF26_01445 [Kiloniella sp.]|nr:hypothetical protein [Kiloniella sp.]RZO30394.1 MAG: hypothetical protein EVA88_03170 [Rhodospirillaceae bacterium]